MSPSNIALVTPVFNDWDAFEILISELSIFAFNNNINIQIIAVDDNSDIKKYPDLIKISKKIKIRIIKLRSNLGHQRAIAIGLCEAFNFKNLDGIVVMDSDGEDKVDDISSLIKNGNISIVVAKRQSRSESLEFKIFYKLYKFIFKILSGKKIDFGNFCYIPFNKIESLIYSPSIWNHLAAGIIRSNNPIMKVATSRGNRFHGKSKLNFTDLVLHGLGAMSVFIDLIFTRLLYFLIIFISIIFLLAIFILIIKFITTLSTPGWTTTLLGILLTVGLQAIIITLISAFMVLNARTTKLFIPAKDSSFFILKRIDIGAN